MAFVPQQWINPYPKLLADRFNDYAAGGHGHAVWARGSFIMSYSGCTSFFSPASVCKSMMSSAFVAAEGLNTGTDLL